MRGFFSELDSAVVVNFGHCVWTLVLGFAVFTVFVENDPDCVADLVFVVATGSILALFVLHDACLFALANEFPVRLERHVEEGIASER